MKPEEIRLNDWMRVLVGEVPGSYFLEIILRMTFVYLLLTVSMRLMGKRMASQLSRNELAALVSLAAATGIPILAPDRGILPALVVAMVIVVIQRTTAWLAYKNQTFERISQGNIAVLVEDSVMNLSKMQKVRITRERLLAELRLSGIFHLGQVKRVYIESSGSFTLVEEEKPQPGLSVVPVWDTDFRDEQKKASDRFVCKNCGNPKQTALKPTDPCTNCNDNNWVPAVET